MKLVLVSNFFNHHQEALCRHLGEELGNDFTFVAERSLPDDRRLLGYPVLSAPYLIRLEESSQAAAEARRRIDAADVVVMGGAYPDILRSRMSRRALTFMYTERPFKEAWRVFDPRVIQSLYRNHARYRGDPLYLLAAGAYVARELRRIGAYPKKALKWGYFPQPIFNKSTDRLWRTDSRAPAKLLWVGRLLDWKRPEAALRYAEKLRTRDRHFRLQIVGSGPLEGALRSEVKRLRLQSHVELLGALPAEAVREKFAGADVSVFTSTRQEGWGAVLNEAMSAGCGVVASLAAGSAPYLIQDGENGLTYQPYRTMRAWHMVDRLVADPVYCQKLGSAAIDTMARDWSPEVAAGRLVSSAQAILNGSYPDFGSGPCSPA